MANAILQDDASRFLVELRETIESPSFDGSDQIVVIAGENDPVMELSIDTASLLMMLLSIDARDVLSSCDSRHGRKSFVFGCASSGVPLSIEITILLQGIVRILCVSLRRK